jgi:uroporphyrinogen III methyltransferase/synthase
MNDPTPSPAAEPAAARRRASDLEPPRRSRRRALLTLLAVALLLAIGYTVLESRREAKVQQQLAETRAQEAAEATARAQAAAEQAQEAQKKLTELEQAAAAAGGEAEAPAPGPGRDEALLLEVERLVTLAAHDLQLTRQNATALAALELADARLAASASPRWAALRRALARDIERLRAVPVVDTTGIALRLDQLIAGADVWPLVTAPAPPPAKAAPRATAKKAEPAAEAAAPSTAPPGAWSRVRQWLTTEFGDLIRINEVATPEALLLTAEQGKLMRQQLKLRLLGARLALLARNDKLYHADIENAQTLLALYFDSRHAGVANAAATLRQANAAALSFDVPTLSDSQTAVRAARLRRQ